MAQTDMTDDEILERAREIEAKRTQTMMRDAKAIHARAAWPELIAQVPKLDTDAYRARAKVTMSATGELVPGVEIVPERQSFSIKVGSGDA